VSTADAEIATGFTPDIDPDLFREVRDDGARVTALLERERELDELDAAIREATSGGGVAVAIEAGAGLGKTRLLQEARRPGTDADVDVLAARATELERESPFSLVRQLFESRLRDLPADRREEIFDGAEAARAALDPNAAGEHDPFAVLHGLYWVTAALAQRKPHLLVVDDLHWADPASLEYLAFLLPRLEELPLALLMACRIDEPGSPAGLGQVLADASVRRLTPAPLSLEATATLLSRKLDRAPDPAFAAACHEASGGNPFLLTELARTLEDQRVEPVAGQTKVIERLAPEGVARMVLTRLGRLPEEAGKLARAVAVFGDDSDDRAVRELTELDSSSAQDNADLLRTSGIFDGSAALRFVHPLVRNAIYADIRAGERAQTHSQAALILSRHGAGVEQVATQLLAGSARGDRATVEALVAAGERALASGAPRAAIAYLERALKEPPPGDLRIAVLDRLITASFRVADPTAFNAAEPHIAGEVAREPSLRSQWAAPMTMLMAMQGRFEEAAAMLEDAIGVAAAEGNMERAFQLEAHMATLALVVPSVPKVDMERFIGEIDPDSPAGRLAAAMEVRIAAVSGTAADIAAAGKRALANDGIIFAEEPELVSATLVVMSLVAADEVDAARHGAERALSIAEEGDSNPTQLIRGWHLRGFTAWGSGDLVQAEADMRQSVNLARMAGIIPLVMMEVPLLAEFLIERDQLGAAEAELESLGFGAGPLPVNPIAASWLMCRGHLRWEQGRPEEAAEVFAALSEQVEELGLGPGPVASMAPAFAKSLMATGKRDRAEELANTMMAWARHFGSASSISHVSRAVAVTRRRDEAVGILREAVAVLDGSPRRLQRVHALVDLGAALRAAGRRSEARPPLREALQLARRCGAVRAAKRARDELQATGETVRRFAPIGVESLTPSERRVAELAASGLTNRQIAQTLFVTVKTVESHLSAAYDKLDIDSRKQLPHALANPAGAET
jgi:DNA-binding CsgD family transcriptional regulator